MKSNYGLIGPYKFSTRGDNTTASGISDVIDAGNLLRTKMWPGLTSVSVSSAVTSISENGTIIFNVAVDGYDGTTAYYWKLNGPSLTPGDVSGGALDSTVALNAAGIGVVQVTFLLDGAVEGNETVYLTIHTGSANGPIQATSANVTLVDSTVTITGASTLWEGDGTVNYSIATNNIVSGTTLYWTANTTQTVATTNAGSFSITTGGGTSGSGIVSLSPVVDAIGSESDVNANLFIRTTSTSGPVLATTALTFKDNTPLITSSPSVNEGSDIVFSVTFPKITQTGTYYVNIISDHVGLSNSDVYFLSTGQLAGTIFISSGTGTTTVRTNVNTVFAAHIFRVEVRTTNSAGPLLSTSANVSIVDSATNNQAEYTRPGTFIWVAPTGVTEVAVVCVGGGGGGHGYSSYAKGGGGGGLGWKNAIPVTPGSSYTVVVGVLGNRSSYGISNTAVRGGNSYFISTATVAGYGGLPGFYSTTAIQGGDGGSFGGDGGGAGGAGGAGGIYAGGGGGAGGYAGSGGSGFTGSASTTAQSGSPATTGSGGGGGGGSGGSIDQAGGGGGVGIYGLGADGIAGTGSTGNARGGGGGSGGQTGFGGTFGSSGGTGATYSNGGRYGGGGGGSDFSTSPYYHGDGGGGAVRIIWGAGRSFPSTNTANI